MIDTRGKSTQEVLDEMAEALEKQGKRCMNPEKTICVYEDDEGNKCAIGLIMDNPPKNVGSSLQLIIQRLRHESQDWDKHFKTNGAFFTSEYSLLVAIQKMHDSKSRELFMKRYKDIEKSFDVNLKPWLGLLQTFEFFIGE